jgi:biotin carboxyl carrier protein
MDKNEPFRISVNDQHQFDVLPDVARELDFVPDGNGAFHVLHAGRSFRAELLEANYPAREFVLLVNGVRCSVHIADQYERLVQQLGLSVGSTQKTNTVKAPMPGLVISVVVEPGQIVAKGDPLLILEAMKMENVLKASSDGRVKNVLVQKGVAVEKGQLLLELE